MFYSHPDRDKASWLLLPTTTTITSTNSTTTYPTRLLNRGAYVAVLLLLVATLLLCLPHLVSAQEEESSFTNILRLVEGGYLCSGSTSGTDLSARFDDLKQVLLDRASVSLYAKSEDIDPVSGYGASVMYQCRGDLTLPNCSACVDYAFRSIYLDQSCKASSFVQVKSIPSVFMFGLVESMGLKMNNQWYVGGFTKQP